MTVYAPSDVRSINIPSGCPVAHEAGDLADGERFSVTCSQCEPLIMATRTGWAHTPEGVHLTPDEIAVVEHEKREAERYKNHTMGDPHKLGKVMATSIAEAFRDSVPAPAPAESAWAAQVDALQAKITELTQMLEEKAAPAEVEADAPDTEAEEAEAEVVEFVDAPEDEPLPEAAATQAPATKRPSRKSAATSKD